VYKGTIAATRERSKPEAAATARQEELRLGKYLDYSRPAAAATARRERWGYGKYLDCRRLGAQ
jgi:DNA primase